MGVIASRKPPEAATRTADMLGSQSREARWRNHAITLLVFVLLGFLFTLPGSLSPGSALLGYPGDNFQHAWFVWHFARAVTHGRNPLYTSLLFYPHRVTLAWSTSDPLAGLMALPFSLLTGPVVAYNLSLILQLALAAFFGRLLCLRICRNEAAAFIGGLAFGFSSWMLAQSLGHLSLVTAFPVPLFVLALDHIVRAQRPSWKSGVLLGLALLLAAFAHYNQVVLCLLFGLFWLLADLALNFTRERFHLLVRIWKPLAAGALTFLAGFSPLLWAMVGNRADIPVARAATHIDAFSADVLGFLIPSWNHILFGRFAHSMAPRIFVAGYEGTVYAGIVVLALAVFGFWKGRKWKEPWAARAALLAVIFYFLSLGPKLRLLGHPLGVPGPAALFYLLPFAKFVSAPVRFAAGTALCLAILCSLGAKYLLERTAGQKQRYALAAAIAALVVCDALTIPFPRSSVANPGEEYASASVPIPAAREGQSCSLPQPLRYGTVLTFPLVTAPYVMKSMWMQIAGGGHFALVDGYLSYSPPYVWSDFWNIRILRSLSTIEGMVHAPIDIAADRHSAPQTIRQLNLSAIIVYDSPQSAAAETYVENVFGANPVREGNCTVFNLAGARKRRQQ